ncbi:MAG: TonB-dependent receptor [Bacteroidales bacterium]|nr:MAG: TonB-dependent receptor [Bacteroidales bacterium]
MKSPGFIISRIIAGFLIIYVFIINIYAQEHKLSGYIYDSTTSKVLTGASIFVKGTSRGTVSNNKGYYSILLKDGNNTIVVSHLGYESVDKDIESGIDINMDFYLKPEVIKADDVVITTDAPENNIESAETGIIELSKEEIEKLPALMGEPDPYRAIQLNPGVQSASEGNTGYYVRGGGTDQNLILLDNATVYNPSHVLGFFSVFNTDMIRNVKLIKSGVPANYGSRLSSVIQVASEDGDYNKYSTRGSIGLISSKISLQGPVFKNKSSFLISFRRSYIDEILKPMIRPLVTSSSSFYNYSRYHFYDLSAKLTYKINRNNRLSVVYYKGRDDFELERSQLNYKNNLYWGNEVISLNWSHIFNENWYCLNTLSYSEYRFSFAAEQREIKINLFSGIEDVNYKLNFNRINNNGNLIRFGLDYQFHNFIPNNIDASSSNFNLNFGANQKLYSHESAVYIASETTITNRLKVNTGLRLSGFFHTGPYEEYIRGYNNEIADTIVYKSKELIESYFNLGPRLSIRYLLNDNSSVKASFTNSYQYIHLATASSVTLPTDVWLPSTGRIKPQKGIHMSLGYYLNMFENVISGSVDLYYKDLKNQVELLYGIVNDYKDNIFEESITFGNGRSYGLELLLKKEKGKAAGWLGYTLGKTTRQFDEINEGDIYPAKYDRRHDINLVLSYKLNNKLTLASTFIYATGNAMTLPVGKYLIEGHVINEYGKTNSFRMPSYHRLDLSVTYLARKTDRFESSWNLSVFNVYNRANPFYIYFEIKEDINNYYLEINAKQISLFPVMPSLTWRFRF